MNMSSKKNQLDVFSQKVFIEYCERFAITKPNAKTVEDALGWYSKQYYKAKDSLGSLPMFRFLPQESIGYVGQGVLEVECEDSLVDDLSLNQSYIGISANVLLANRMKNRIKGSSNKQYFNFNLAENKMPPAYSFDTVVINMMNLPSLAVAGAIIDNISSNLSSGASYILGVGMDNWHMAHDYSKILDALGKKDFNPDARKEIESFCNLHYTKILQGVDVLKESMVSELLKAKGLEVFVNFSKEEFHRTLLICRK